MEQRRGTSAGRAWALGGLGFVGVACAVGGAIHLPAWLVGIAAFATGLLLGRHLGDLDGWWAVRHQTAVARRAQRLNRVASVHRSSADAAPVTSLDEHRPRATDTTTTTVAVALRKAS